MTRSSINSMIMLSFHSKTSSVHFQNIELSCSTQLSCEWNEMHPFISSSHKRELVPFAKQLKHCYNDICAILLLYTNLASHSMHSGSVCIHNMPRNITFEALVYISHRHKLSTKLSCFELHGLHRHLAEVC